MAIDWDDAYSNGAYIAGGDRYPAKWRAAAETFRATAVAEERAQLDIAYGSGSRQVFDLFLTNTPPKGLFVFVHGGYWLAFDKSSWSHLAAGAIAAGWAVAIPSYTLAPEVSVSAITREVGLAVKRAAAMVAGPIRLAGHSAGGHLVTRLVCADGPLAVDVQRRITHVVSISGLHDLRPLRHTAMAAKLFGLSGEAAAESPALHEPMAGLRLTCWVGSEERPEFLRQNDLLANIWRGLGAETASVHESGRHHFSVVEGLAESASPLLAATLKPV